MSTTLGQRLKIARAHAAKTMQVKKLSQVKIAKMCGWGASNQSRIGNYETDYREPSLREIKQLAIAYGVSNAWLCTGSGHMLQADDGYFVGERQQEYGAKPSLITIPIITWAQASSPPAEPPPFTGTAAFTIKTCSERAFALNQQGNSMEPPSGLGCRVWAPAGCLLIADPDAAHTPGCFTIAQPAGFPEPFCRQLIVDGGKMVLVALNPQYQNIEVGEGCRLIAPVIDIQLPYN